MSEIPGHLWAVVGATAVAAAVAWRVASTARERRGRFQRGEARELDRFRTKVHGCRVFARASTAAADPNREPVVLVHGLGISGAYFVPTAERLAPEFDVYVPDLPGHGRSDSPRSAMDIPRLADALIAWMDAVGLDRVSLLGHSMGCQIVVDAAVRYPERVDRLVLIGSTGDPSGRTVVQMFWRFAISVPFERPSLARLVAAACLRMRLRLLPEFLSMLSDPVEDKLPLVGVPTLLVRGEHDFIAPPRWLDEMARLLGTDHVTVIPWWGHAVNYSASRQLVEAIAPFLRAERRRPGGASGRCLEESESGALS